jgi:hypothetical protein
LSTPLGQTEDVLSTLLGGDAPRDLRVFAARGILPLDRDSQIRALLFAVEDPDAEIAALARATLRATAPEDLSRFLASGANEAELDTLARGCDDPFVLEAVIRNRNVLDSTLEWLGGRVTGAPQEALVVNQVRLLRNPDLIESLFQNPDLSAESRRRLNEIREEFFEKQARRREKMLQVQAEAPPATDAASEAAADAVPPEQAAAAEGEEGALEDSLNVAAIYRRIAVMTVSEKIKLAYGGGKEERRILIGDANRLVGLAVLKSRGLTVNEVEGYCALRSLDDEIYRKIAGNREWSRKQSVMLALVKNPRVPLALTLPLIKQLRERDLKGIMRDPNLPEGLRIASRKLVMERRR